uniref:GG16972 n=1 Tax=Drosophila erecta TaxID=7220 RepID=B3P3Y5_DROER
MAVRWIRVQKEAKEPELPRHLKESEAKAKTKSQSDPVVEPAPRMQHASGKCIGGRNNWQADDKCPAALCIEQVNGPETPSPIGSTALDWRPIDPSPWKSCRALRDGD